MDLKLLFFIGLATLLFTMPVNAQSGEPSIPNPPPSNSYVLDTLNWLIESQEQEINTIARQLDSEGKAQIYVATLDDCGNDKTQYRRDIFNAWKIGTQKSDGGLLILVCWYNGDKSRRSVEVKTDAKMQIVIPDALTATIAENNFVPAFKENQPGAGLVKMVMVFDNVIHSKKSATVPPSSNSLTSDNSWVWIIITLFLILIFSIDWKRLLRGEGFGWVSGNRRDGDSYRGDSSGSDGGGSDGGGSSTSF